MAKKLRSCLGFGQSSVVDRKIFGKDISITLPSRFNIKPWLPLYNYIGRKPLV